MTDQQVDGLLERLDRIAAALEVLIKGSLMGQADSTEQILNEQRSTAATLQDRNESQ